MTKREIRAVVWKYRRQGAGIGTAYSLAANDLNLNRGLVVSTWLKMHNRWLAYVLLKKYNWNPYDY